MNNIPFALGCLLATALFGSQCEAQSAHPKFLSETTISVVKSVKGQLRPLLSEQDRRILDEIDFRVSDFSYVQAEAYKNDSGRRIVMMHLGIAFVITAFADADYVASKGFRQCSVAYLTYLQTVIVANTVARAPPNRLPIGIIGDFSHPSCTGVMQLLVNTTPDVMDLLAIEKGQSIAVVVLHEIAHHVLGHVDKQARTLEQSREREAAADSWALTKIIEFGGHPAALLPWAMFQGSLPLTLEAEGQSTHPAGPRRALEIIKKAQAELIGAPAIRQKMQAFHDLLTAYVPQ
jgi:hypothetical protein